jgi:hypothetical protein
MLGDPDCFLGLLLITGIEQEWLAATDMLAYYNIILLVKNTIASRFSNETMSFGPQTFIVKLLINR